MENSKLKKVRVKRISDTIINLDIIYEIEKLDGIYEREFNDVPVRISDFVDIWTEAAYSLPCGNAPQIYNVDFGFGPIKYDVHTLVYKDKLMRENVYEMTLEEIEQKLGHKVKIVSGGENDG